MNAHISTSYTTSHLPIYTFYLNIHRKLVSPCNQSLICPCLRIPRPQLLVFLMSVCLSIARMNSSRWPATRSSVVLERGISKGGFPLDTSRPQNGRRWFTLCSVHRLFLVGMKIRRPKNGYAAWPSSSEQWTRPDTSLPATSGDIVHKIAGRNGVFLSTPIIR